MKKNDASKKLWVVIQINVERKREAEDLKRSGYIIFEWYEDWWCVHR